MAKAQRVLIGAMGKTAFDGAEYVFQNRQSSISSYFIHALAENRNPDVVIILLTDEAKQTQWEGKDKLQDWFSSSLPQVKLVPVTIPKGGNIDEAWDIFNAIASAIPEDAEVTIDITNGLRSIPVLLLSATRYLQNAKRIKISEIYYCAFDTTEARSDPKPVYPLSLFNALLDWSNAVWTFEKTGKSSLLAEVLQQNTLANLGEDWSRISTVLVDLSQSLDLLRVESVMKLSARLNKLLKDIDTPTLSNTLRPFVLLLDEIRSQFSRFAMEDTRNPQRAGVFLRKLLDLMDWYVEHSRYSEALLLSREWFISSYMFRNGNPKFFTYKGREEAVSELNQKVQGKSPLNDDLQFWKDLRSARNDLAHPFSGSPKDTDELIKQVKTVRTKLRKMAV